MNILICDDDIKAVRQCEAAIQAISERCDEKLVVSEAVSSAQLRARDFAFNFDLIFLDIELGDGDGVREAERLREKGYTGDIIFLTRHEERMREAFDVAAFNFLVKGDFDTKEFERVLLKSIEAYNERSDEILLLSYGADTRRIAISEIVYFEVNNRVISVFYRHNKQFDFYAQLGRIEQSLIGKGFVRCHKSYLVAVSHIQSFGRSAEYRPELVLDTGKHIAVSPRYTEEVKKAMRADSIAISTGSVSV